MKILHVMGGALNGGAEGFFIDAVNALSQSSSVEQSVVVHDALKDQITHKIPVSVSVHAAPFSKIKALKTRGILKRAIKNFQPDIVQYWMARAGQYAVKGDHVNVGWYSSYKNPRHFKNCDYHIGVTPHVCAHIIDHGVAQDKVFSVPIYTPFIDAPSISRAVFSTPKDVPLFLTLARLHPVKGLDVLIRAMNNVPDAHLWIAGDGPLESELKALTRDLNIGDRVKFLGWRDDKDALLATCDYCVFPSRNDSFGAVMTEAWAHKKPFIATRAPGPRAYVTHEENGLLVEIDDVTGLARAMNRVIIEKNLTQTLISNGYQKYQDNFTPDAYVERSLTMYKTIITKK